MVKLGAKESALVAVGASRAANCTSCLEDTVNWAKEFGANQGEIEVAVEIGKWVRAGTTVQSDPFALASRYNAFQISRAFLVNEGYAELGWR